MGRRAHPSRTRWSRYARDVAAAIAVAIVSLATGLAINRFGSAPIPLLYHSPAERLEAQLDELITAPQAQVSPPEMIGLDQFRRLASDGSTVIIDARARPFYEQGHVPGALNLSRDQFGRDYRRLRSVIESRRGKQFVVYCSSFQCQDSRLVARALVALGFSRVEVFGGGWQAWTQAGLAVSRR